MAISSAVLEEYDNDFEIISEDRNLKPLPAYRLSEIKAQPVEWLWKPFLALGTFNLIQGEEGIGKTFLVCALASAIGSGKGLPTVPEIEHIEPSNVLLISAEDSLAHVLKPRLEAMNAPCERIIAIEEPFTLNRDGIFRLSMAIAEFEPKLIVIDPLFSYTGKINLDRDSDIRSVTDELKRLAEKYQCSIVGIRHVGKSKGFGDPRNAGLNGVGWGASARSVLLIGKNPENESQKALCQTKNNLAPKFEKSLGFEISGGEFFWTGESSLTAETMLSSVRNESGEEKAERSEAVAFLQEALADGAKLAKDVKREAAALGLTEQNLRTARAKIGVVVKKNAESFDRSKHFWTWELPTEDVSNKSKDGVKSNNQHLWVNHSNKISCINNLPKDVSNHSNQHLQTENQHLPSPKCGCGLVMELIENDKTWFCPIGCEKRKAN